MEGKSRLLSAVISGGMILDSSRLADDSQRQAFAKSVYDNPGIFAVASEGRVFRPVEGDTGNKAATAFVRSAANGLYLAVFNYNDKDSQTIRIPLERISSEMAETSVAVIDVASGAKLASASGDLTIEMQPAESKLLLIQQGQPLAR